MLLERSETSYPKYRLPTPHTKSWKKDLQRIHGPHFLNTDTLIPQMEMWDSDFLKVHYTHPENKSLIPKTKPSEQKLNTDL